MQVVEAVKEKVLGAVGTVFLIFYGLKLLAGQAFVSSATTAFLAVNGTEAAN